MVGLFCLGRIPTTVRVLVIHAMLSFYVDVLATLNTTVNNHIVFILYIPFDLLLVSLAARDYLGRTFLPLIVSGLLIAISVFVYVLNKRGGEYIPFEAVVTSFIIQGIIWFIAMLRTSRHSLQRDTIAVYLISGSLLLFVCGSVPMWAMYRYNMVHNPGLSKSLQGLVSIANVLRYSGTAIAFILLANNQTPRQPHAGG
jgi:hypothetical protein